MYKILLYHSFIVIFLFLTACNPYRIEMQYDEFRKTQTCSLKNGLLLSERSVFKGTRTLELNLDRVDKNIIVALFSLSDMEKSSFFKPDSHIIFTLIDKDNSQECIELKSIGLPQNKSTKEPIYIFLNSIGYMGVQRYIDKTTSMVLARLTPEQVKKIAMADKVMFSLETMDEPLRGNLEKEDLAPFQEFVENCLKASSSIMCPRP